MKETITDLENDDEFMMFLEKKRLGITPTDFYSTTKRALICASMKFDQKEIYLDANIVVEMEKLSLALLNLYNFRSKNKKNNELKHELKLKCKK